MKRFLSSAFLAMVLGAPTARGDYASGLYELFSGTYRIENAAWDNLDDGTVINIDPYDAQLRVEDDGSVAAYNLFNYQDTLRGYVDIEENKIILNVVSSLAAEDGYTFTGLSEALKHPKPGEAIEITDLPYVTIDLPEDGSTLHVNGAALLYDYSRLTPEYYGYVSVYYLISEFDMTKTTDAPSYLAEDEYDALKSLYEEIKDAPGYWFNWDFTSGAYGVSRFYGVEVEDGHITSLDIRSLGIGGTLPSALADMPMLKWLDISHNEMSGDLAAAIAAIVKDKPSAFANLSYLSVYDNRYTGNITALAACLPSLTQLTAQYNCFADVYPAIPERVYASIDWQDIDKTIDIDLSDINIAELAKQLPTIFAYDVYNRTWTPDISIIVTDKIDDDYFGYGNFAVRISHSDGIMSVQPCHSAPFTGNDGDLLYAYSELNGSRVKIKLHFVPYDADFSGSVDVLDLQSILYFTLYDYLPDKIFNFTAANIWEDDVINVQDAVAMVNILAEQPINAARQRVASDIPDSPLAYVSDGRIWISADRPVGAFDIIVADPVSVAPLDALRDMGFSCRTVNRDNCTRLIGYSLTGDVLPAGDTPVATIGAGHIAGTVLSDPKAARILEPHASTSAITGVTGVTDHSLLRIDDGMMTLTRDAADITWQILAVDGTVIARGEAPRAAANTVLTSTLPKGISIATVAADGLSPITIKINNTK